MEAISDRPADPLAAWLAATHGGAAGAPPPSDDARPTPSGSWPRRRLLAVAAVPWVAVIALGAVTTQRATPAAPPAPAAARVTASPSPAPPDPSDADPQPAVLDDELAAAAVLTVRLSTPPDQYLDTAVAERVDTLDGAAVVTVAAAVLDRVDGGWAGPRAVRFAVPLSLGHSRPAALSAPWVLPGTDRPRAEPETTPVDDDALTHAAATALRAAGYRDIAVAQLRRHSALPDVLAVHVRARAPGEPGERDHEIWLDAAASHVLGAAVSAEPVQLPAPVPAEAP